MLVGAHMQHNKRILNFVILSWQRWNEIRYRRIRKISFCLSFLYGLGWSCDHEQEMPQHRVCQRYHRHCSESSRGTFWNNASVEWVSEGLSTRSSPLRSGEARVRISFVMSFLLFPHCLVSPWCWIRHLQAYPNIEITIWAQQDIWEWFSPSQLHIKPHLVFQHLTALFLMQIIKNQSKMALQFLLWRSCGSCRRLPWE